MLVAPVAGCNKDKLEGVYVFDSMEILEGFATKSYTCPASDKASSVIVANSFVSIGDGKVEWKIEEDVAYYYVVANAGNLHVLYLSIRLRIMFLKLKQKIQ